MIIKESIIQTLKVLEPNFILSEEDLLLLVDNVSKTANSLHMEQTSIISDILDLFLMEKLAISK